MARLRAKPRRAPARAPRRRDPSARELWLVACLIALLGLAGRIAWYKHYNEALFLRVGPDGMINFNQAVDHLRDLYGATGGEPTGAYYREYLPPGYPLFLATLWKLIPLHGVIGEREFWIAAVRAARVMQWLLAAGVTLMTFALARRVLFGYSALLPPLILTASIAMVDVPNLLAPETLLAFLLTATVLLSVKAREASAIAMLRAEAQRERDAAALERDHTAAALESDYTAELIDGDDFVPHDEFDDDSRWSTLDEPPPEAKRRDWTGLCVLLAGFSLSCAVLVQPRFALFLPFAAVWMLRALPKVHVAVFVIVTLMLPLGWVARNYGEHERILPLSISAQAGVYEDNVDPIGGDGTADGASPVACPRQVLSSGDPEQRQAWADCMFSEGIDEITAHPRDSLAAVGDRLAAMLSPWNVDYARGPYASDLFSYPDIVPVSTRENPSYATSRDWLNVLWIVFYAALILLGAVGLWAEGPGSSARLIVLPLIALPLSLLVYHGENLQRLPMLPLIAIAVTLGLIALAEKLFHNNRLKNAFTV